VTGVQTCALPICAVQIGNTTSSSAINITANAASIWQVASANLTVQTLTSGILALTSAGAINLTGAATSTWQNTSGTLTIQSSGGSANLALSCVGGPLNISTATSGNIVINPGSSSIILTFGGGMQVGGSPTGGDKGVGTINVSSNIYLNNTAYTSPDFVLEHYITGKIERFLDSPGARDYPGLMPLLDVERFYRENLHLPRIGRGPAGLVERFDWILEKIEEVYIHLVEHEKRLQNLEGVVR